MTQSRPHRVHPLPLMGGHHSGVQECPTYNERYRNEYFIQGKPETTFREVVRGIWPFEDHDVNSSWKLLADTGEDVADRPLSSYEGIVEIKFAIPEG